MRRYTVCLLIVWCLLIGIGYVAGTIQEAGADDGPYGKYVHSTDPAQYIELRPDGTCNVVAREYTPSGQPGKQLHSASGRYEINGDIITVIGPKGKLEWGRLEGNTIVPETKYIPRGHEGAKFIRK